MRMYLCFSGLHAMEYFGAFVVDGDEVLEIFGELYVVDCYG